MSNINNTNQIGRFTADPILKYTPAGKSVANFTIAVNDSYGSGEDRKEYVNYFDCITWNRPGEVIAEYCKKGHLIAIEGKLKQRRWKDESSGNGRSKIEIVVTNFQFLQSKKDSAGSIPEENEQPNDKNDSPFSDDEIPF